MNIDYFDKRFFSEDSLESRKKRVEFLESLSKDDVVMMFYDSGSGHPAVVNRVQFVRSSKTQFVFADRKGVEYKFRRDNGEYKSADVWSRASVSIYPFDAEVFADYVSLVKLANLSKKVFSAVSEKVVETLAEISSGGVERSDIDASIDVMEKLLDKISGK